jgi:hypothetical protein
MISNVVNHLLSPLASAAAPDYPLTAPFSSLPLPNNIFNNNHFQHSQASTPLKYQFIIKPIITNIISHRHNNKVDPVQPRSLASQHLTTTLHITSSQETLIPLNLLAHHPFKLLPYLPLNLCNPQHQSRSFNPH